MPNLDLGVRVLDLHDMLIWCAISFVDTYSHRSGKRVRNFWSPNFRDLLLRLSHEIRWLEIGLDLTLALRLVDVHLNDELLLVKSLIYLEQWTTSAVHPLLEECIEFVESSPFCRSPVLALSNSLVMIRPTPDDPLAFVSRRSKMNRTTADLRAMKSYSEGSMSS
ncbi:hypothetical protein KCU98_g89, partial [Aureobasidium melanogenum]